MFTLLVSYFCYFILYCTNHFNIKAFQNKTCLNNFSIRNNSQISCAYYIQQRLVFTDTCDQRPLSRNLHSTEPPSPSCSSSSFSIRRSARLVRVQPRGADTQSENRTQNITETPKRTTSTGSVLRRFKYKVNKEFQLLHKRITELKAVNAKYKKQINRMKKKTFEPQPSTSKTETRIDIVSQNKRELLRKGIEESVKLFFEDDENSQLCPGKKDCITRNKAKKQKRLLLDSLLNLHKKYLALNPRFTISYSAFCKLRPFWVVTPNVNSRETCLCKTHENMDLVFAALKRNKIVEQKSLQEVTKYICCDSTTNECLKRICDKCKDKHLLYNEFDDSQEIHYWTWNTEKKMYIKNGTTKTSRTVTKKKIIASPKTVIIEFEKQLTPYMKHVSNIISQHRYIKQIKSDLKQDECIIHCDFSENYNAKYTREIQAVHFGGSRNQLTLHTVVLYYRKDGKMITTPYCTVSESLRHDAIAIWEHLLPILKFLEDEAPQVDALYFVSDSPSAQYRNRKMFFIMSVLNWHYPSLRTVEWNYSESGHGKGAPDGVGGVLKRTADQLVARGVDITSMDSLLQCLKKNVPGVYIETVSEAGMFEKELLIPKDLKEFTGTMGVHQVLWNANTSRKMTMRELSCGLEPCFHSTIQCPHGLHKGFFDVDLRNEEKIDKSVIIEKRPQKKTLKSSSVKVANKKPVILSNILLKPGSSGFIQEIKVTEKTPININCEMKQSTKELESTGDIELSDNDSFWVPGLIKDYEQLMTPKTSNNIISSLSNEADENSNDSDYNIF